METDWAHVLADHSSFHIQTEWEYVRAIAWVTCNLITAVSYLLIPYEISKWKSVLPFITSLKIAWLFIAFIILCGLSHIIMLVIMPTAPWWTLSIFVPMAFVSLATTLFLRLYRDYIISALSAISRALQ